MVNQYNNIQRRRSIVSSTPGGFGNTSMSFRLFCLALIFIYLNFLRGAFDVTGLLFPKHIRVLFIMLGPVFLSLSTLTALCEGQLKRLKPTYRSWLVVLLFIYAVLLLSGILIFRNEIRHVTLDFLLLPFFFTGILMGSKEQNWFLFDKIMMVFFTINAFACLYWIGGFSGYLVDRRSVIIAAFNQTPYFFWGNLSVWPYFILTMMDKSILRKIVTIIGTLLYFSFAVIFLKRTPFICLSLFIFLVFIKTGIRQWAKVAVLLLAGVIVIWQISQFYSGGEAQTMMEKLKMRFIQQDSIAETLIMSTRFGYDPKLVLTQFSGLEYIVGRGLGGVVKDVQGTYPEAMTHTLHNGSALIMLKGGIVLLIVWTGGWLFLFKDFIVNRDYTLNRYYIPVLIPFLLSWVFGFLSGSVGFLFLMMCAGRVMSRNYKSSENKG